MEEERVWMWWMANIGSLQKAHACSYRKWTIYFQMNDAWDTIWTDKLQLYNSDALLSYAYCYMLMVTCILELVTIKLKLKQSMPSQSKLSIHTICHSLTAWRKIRLDVALPKNSSAESNIHFEWLVHHLRSYLIFFTSSFILRMIQDSFFGSSVATTKHIYCLWHSVGQLLNPENLDVATLLISLRSRPLRKG
mgnify:CR=1 FL=1